MDRLCHGKLAESGTVILNAPGNDDPMVVDDVLREHGDERFRFVEGEIVEIAPGHEMLSTGYTNHTPWNTHREYTETEIAESLKAMTDRLRIPRRPCSTSTCRRTTPASSRSDAEPNLSVETSGGAQITGPVDPPRWAAIEEVQPLVTLHGHIHESGGSVRIGRTVSINAGSEYGEGVLRGVLVTVGGGKLLRQQAVTG